MNDLVSLFNLNLRKREIIRADVFSELQDSIATQMSKRLEKNQDTFSNKDLLDYLVIMDYLVLIFLLRYDIVLLEP